MSAYTSRQVVEQSVTRVQSQGLLPTGFVFGTHLADVLDHLLRSLAPLTAHISDEMIDQNIYTMAAVALSDALTRAELDMGVGERVAALESLLNEIHIVHKEMSDEWP